MDEKETTHTKSDSSGRPVWWALQTRRPNITTRDGPKEHTIPSEKRGAAGSHALGRQLPR